MNLVVYNPTSGPIPEKTVMAQRVDTLQDGVLGVIDNGKRNSDKVLNQILLDLKSLYRLKDVVSVKKENASHGVSDDMAQMLARECDFVIAGIGD